MTIDYRNFGVNIDQNITINASGTSARAALPDRDAPDLIIFNPTAETLWVRTGDDTVVADANAFPIAAGEKGTYRKGQSPNGIYTHIAVFKPDGAAADVIIVQGRGS